MALMPTVPNSYQCLLDANLNLRVALLTVMPPEGTWVNNGTLMRIPDDNYVDQGANIDIEYLDPENEELQADLQPVHFSGKNLTQTYAVVAWALVAMFDDGAIILHTEELPAPLEFGPQSDDLVVEGSIFAQSFASYNSILNFA